MFEEKKTGKGAKQQRSIDPRALVAAILAAKGMVQHRGCGQVESTGMQFLSLHGCCSRMGCREANRGAKVKHALGRGRANAKENHSGDRKSRASSSKDLCVNTVGI